MLRKRYCLKLNLLSSFLMLLLSLGISSPAKAQKNFIEGFVLYDVGDTLKGFIDYQEWVKNPNTIDFKESENAQVRNYGLLQIYGFGVADTYYQGARVKIETSPVRTNFLSTESDFKFEDRFVFLKAVVLGGKSLYLYKDENAKDHFYIETENGFELLRYKIHKEGLLMVKNNTFHGQLDWYLGDCANISSNISNAS